MLFQTTLKIMLRELICYSKIGYQINSLSSIFFYQHVAELRSVKMHAWSKVYTCIQWHSLENLLW